VNFLEKVARTLYDSYRGEMEKQVVILPSRRAGLYLARHLSRLSNKPQWSPKMVTVTELFESFSTLHQSETESLIFDLYKSYLTSVANPLPFDDFWSWGETILTDFNDIDLWLADAEKIYSNISDLKEIDHRFGGLTEEQIEIIRGFWTSFNPADTGSEARTAFKTVWQVLGPLYKSFSEKLAASGKGWEGMICREVAEKAASNQLPLPDDINYHVAGLNALNNCEKELFLFLKRQGRVKFYWDDDHGFMKQKDHKASVFIKENLHNFGNDLPQYDEELQPEQKNRWTIIDTPSDSAQAKMLPEILREAGLDSVEDATDTAVILADEKLLAPVLSSLPEEIKEVNVTMGHPFKYTPLYSFIKQLFILARYASHHDGELTFRAENVLGLIRHQYFPVLSKENTEIISVEIISGNMIRVGQKYLAEKMAGCEVFDVPENVNDYPAYLLKILTVLYENSFGTNPGRGIMSIDREYMRMSMNEGGKLRNLIAEHGFSLKIDTCIRLMDRIFKRLIVPFSGEPLKGLQVMGVLETRALEFKNMIFLSLNEGIFPNQSYENTFIPYNIRRAFGLPTINEHESIYSYHFFRLLRRPQRGWFMYNSTTQGMSTGEMSRYLIQMKYGSEYSPVFSTLHILVGRSSIVPDVLQKNEGHIKSLLKRYTGLSEDGKDKIFSPSAINTWLTCRMKFYYRYVCGIAEEDKLEKEIDQRRFGNILHAVMEEIYKPLIGTVADASILKTISSDAASIRKIIIQKASSEMRWSEESLLGGKSVIIIDVLARYIKNILDYDGTIKDLTVLHLEKKFCNVFEVGTPMGKQTILVGGITDRVDSASGMVRVVDYKTGSPKDNGTTLDKLFDETVNSRSDAVLQTLLYCNALRSYYPDRIIQPAIYWIQQISAKDFSSSVRMPEFEASLSSMQSYTDMMNRYETGLKEVLENIFSADQHFTMTSFQRKCSSCPYRLLCQR
jgi:CRISPR/Cas system-associated exonuclease Cas4 (RecB family)